MSVKSTVETKINPGGLPPSINLAIPLVTGSHFAFHEYLSAIGIVHPTGQSFIELFLPQGLTKRHVYCYMATFSTVGPGVESFLKTDIEFFANGRKLGGFPKANGVSIAGNQQSAVSVNPETFQPMPEMLTLTTQNTAWEFSRQVMLAPMIIDIAADKIQMTVTESVNTQAFRVFLGCLSKK